MKKILLYINDSVFNNNEIFRPDSWLNRDDCLLPFQQLKKDLFDCGFDLNTVDVGNISTCDFMIFFNVTSSLSDLKIFADHLKKKMILFLWEPPVVLPLNWDPQYHSYFHKVFTWNDDLVDHDQYQKLFWPQPNRRYSSLPFNEKKLCTMINGNKSSVIQSELYSERIKAIRFFERKDPKNFDLYGSGWNKEQFPSYLGEIKEKGTILGHYRFAVCFENMKNMNGYLTEKIFDCFRSGCVPIYLGAENITDYVPANTFIDFRDFADYETLYDYLITMTEVEYNKILLNIHRFLNSPIFSKQFSIEAFCESVITNIVELDG